jgi:hypothetical protein
MRLTGISKEKSVELTWEWIVIRSSKGDGYVVYRGTDESHARKLFDDIVPRGDWGGTLQRRQIGPTEDVEVKR